MNAKKAKALRKVLKNLISLQAAKGETTISEKTTYTENQQNRKSIIAEDFNEKGDLVKKIVPIASGTITVNKKCKRGLYLHLKKTMNQSLIPTNFPKITSDKLIEKHV